MLTPAGGQHEPALGSRNTRRSPSSTAGKELFPSNPWRPIFSYSSLSVIIPTVDGLLNLLLGSSIKQIYFSIYKPLVALETSRQGLKP